jgi:hypothetical protein
LVPHAGQMFGADKPTPRGATDPMVIETSGGPRGRSYFA